MKKTIVVKGARQHNLKNVDLEIPRDELVVFTGVSGSGKSSLAFDTLYAEGQRRYVESLSSYARQFLGQMEKPQVDRIEGLSPAISIDQKAPSRNPRSTVGTVTEIQDYLRVIFARLGVQHCHRCGRKVGRQTPGQMAQRLREFPSGTRLILYSPLVRGRKGEYRELLRKLRNEGFTRLRIDGGYHDLQEGEAPRLSKTMTHDLEVLIDRVRGGEGQRIAVGGQHRNRPATLGRTAPGRERGRRGGLAGRGLRLRSLRDILRGAHPPALLLQFSKGCVFQLQRSGNPLAGRPGSPRAGS